MAQTSTTRGTHESFQVSKILKDCVVCLSSIRWPIIWPSGEIVFALTVDHEGTRKRFVSIERPAIYTKDSEIWPLSAEIEFGSVIDVQVAGDLLLAIQMAKPENINPFLSAA